MIVMLGNGSSRFYIASYINMGFSDRGLLAKWPLNICPFVYLIRQNIRFAFYYCDRNIENKQVSQSGYWVSIPPWLWNRTFYLVVKCVLTVMRKFRTTKALYMIECVIGSRNMIIKYEVIRFLSVKSGRGRNSVTVMSVKDVDATLYIGWSRIHGTYFKGTYRTL